MAAQARVGRARSRSDGPRGERVCVMCGASKCFACGACGLSAYCGAVCQKRDYGAHYVVCKAARGSRRLLRAVWTRGSFPRALQSLGISFFQGGWAQGSCLASQEHSEIAALRSNQIDHKRRQSSTKLNKKQSKMNDSQSRFAKMPAAPPSPPTLPRQSFASLGSPAEETGEAGAGPLGHEENRPSRWPGRATARSRLVGAGPGRANEIVAKTHVGARNVGRGERVGGGHGRASAAMSVVAVLLTSISRRASSS